jgi:hypothetical protein
MRPTLLFATHNDPFVQTDWPVPPGPSFPVILRSWILPAAAALLTPVVSLPPQTFDYPNPRGPQQGAITQRTWIDPLKLNLQGQDALPFRQADWPVPKGPARSSTLEHLVNPALTVATIRPFIQSEWPIPIPPQWASDLRTWIDQSSNLLEVAVAFSQTDWPVPKGYEHPIVLRTWTDPLKLNLQGQDALPFFQSEWPVFRPVPIPVSDWVAGQSLPVRTIPVIHLGPGFVEHAPTFAPVEPPPPKRHRVERELDRKHLRRIIERAYAAQQQPVEQIVAYLTQLALEGQLMPSDYLALLYAQLPRDLIDVDTLIAMVERAIYLRRMEIEERDIEAILLSLD